MRINFDFADLETFLAVMETGTFHGAGMKLNISQPSVTRRLQKLELALGTTLFERTTRAVKPTLAAKQLQQRAEALVETAEETARALRDESDFFEHQRSQTVTIATIPTVVSGLIAPAVQHCGQEAQNMRIRLLDLSANEVAEAVVESEADFGICSIPLTGAATTFERLFDDPMVLAVPAKHSLASKDCVAWSDLVHEKLILPARGTGNRLIIDEALARSGFNPTWAFEIGRSTTGLDLVASGLAVAPVPLTSMSMPPDGVRHRPLRSPSISRPVGLVQRTGQSETPLTRQLMQKIRSIASGLNLLHQD